MFPELKFELTSRGQAIIGVELSTIFFQVDIFETKKNNLKVQNFYGLETKHINLYLCKLIDT